MINPEDMYNEIIEIQAELENTRKVLSTLIAWLYTELGEQGVNRLLEMMKEGSE